MLNNCTVLIGYTFFFKIYLLFKKGNKHLTYSVLKVLFCDQLRRGYAARVTLLTRPRPLDTGVYKSPVSSRASGYYLTVPRGRDWVTRRFRLFLNSVLNSIQPSRKVLTPQTASLTYFFDFPTRFRSLKRHVSCTFTSFCTFPVRCCYRLSHLWDSVSIKTNYKTSL